MTNSSIRKSMCRMIWSSSLWKDCCVFLDYVFAWMNCSLGCKGFDFFPRSSSFFGFSLFVLLHHHGLMCVFFFFAPAFFGAGDLWICLGYRVYILDSSHVVSIHLHLLLL